MKKFLISKISVLAGCSIALLALTGCEDKTSVEWYVSHHEDMFAKYTECLINHNFLPVDCQNARSAMRREQNKPDVQEGLKTAREKVLNAGGQL